MHLRKKRCDRVKVHGQNATPLDEVEVGERSRREHSRRDDDMVDSTKTLDTPVDCRRELRRIGDVSDLRAPRRATKRVRNGRLEGPCSRSLHHQFRGIPL